MSSRSKNGGDWVAVVEKKVLRLKSTTVAFARYNWKGTTVILLATLIFFWPMLTRLNSYSEGGDAMFNAWTLSRNHSCILRQDCASYLDANIYYPNEDTMLYSEAQTSAGLLTLPLHWFSDNPVFAYNVWTILSVFFGGWFMYLLVKYLSKNELMSIISGLVFAFAPFKMAAISHMQNLSIFFLPLILLLVLKYLKVGSRKYLWLLLIALVLQFYASWYNLIFVLIFLSVLLTGFFVTKFAKPKSLLLVGLTIFAAVLATVPLMKEYMRFSNENDAKFSIEDQLLYSSSVKDYFIPHEGTLIGKAYYSARPDAQPNAYNLDSFSYHGLSLYVLLVVILYLAYRYRKVNSESKNNFKLLAVVSLIGIVGLVFSLGPLLKVGAEPTQVFATEHYRVVIPAPWLVVVKILPQIAFVRAIGRISVLFLFALCFAITFLPYYLNKLGISDTKKKWAYGVLILLIFIELAPLHFVPMSKVPQAYNMNVPDVYKFIKSDPDIDKIVILNANYDYPGATTPMARAEQVLWSGYHNKHIFNGYSGYTPLTYFEDFEDFVNFEKSDVDKLKKLDIHYVLVDKELMTNKPRLNDNVKRILKDQIYNDDRYSLYKVN